MNTDLFEYKGQKIAPTNDKVEAIQICFKKAFSYSHSIVALGFGDIS